MAGRRNTAVPVVVLAGFLGAGKTTLLNHLLAEAGGRRIGILVNDFGSVNIDALLVSGAFGPTISLPGGCICCATDAAGLDDALTALSAPSADLDAIVIEASGIAEPKALIRMVLAATGSRIAYGGLVYLVDAAGLEATLADHPSVAEHIAVADLVVCNKIDLLTASTRGAGVDDGERAIRRLRERIRRLNGSAPIVAVREAAVDPGLLFDAVAERAVPEGPRQLMLDELLAESAPRLGGRGADRHDGSEHAAGHDHGAGQDHDEAHEHLHAEFESVSLDVPEPIDPRRLAQLLVRPPMGTYRIKGAVYVDQPGHRGRAYEVHAVGGFVRVSTRPWGGRPPASALVIIGAGLDAPAAREALEGLRMPDTADSSGILQLTRYLA